VQHFSIIYLFSVLVTTDRQTDRLTDG